MVDAAQELMNSNVHGVTSAKIIAENVQHINLVVCKNYFPVTLVFVKRLPNAPWQNWILIVYFVWTDEVYFHLNGKVNSIRGSAWSPAPVKVLHEQPLHSPKVLLWRGFKTDFVMDPFFFDNSIKGAAYRDRFTCVMYFNWL